ncbi:MAG TPA: sialidase family protein [Acidimicrobiales bacterium]|nr:sialidase family protein [Acidimicrobiales bacterium]
MARHRVAGRGALILLLTLSLTAACDGGGAGDGARPAQAPRPVAGPGVQIGVEDEEALIRAASTPVLAVNPDDPDNYVVGYRIELPAFSCAVATSFDAGTSWAPAALELPPGTERCYTTSLAFDGDGVLHLLFVTLAGPGNVPSAAWLTRSTDGGRTFEPAVQVLDAEKFMVRLIVDPTASPADLYLTWVEGSGIGFLQMAPPSSVMVRASTDGGRTFGPPARVSDAGRDRVGAAVPLLLGPDALAVFYFDYRRDAFDFQNLPGRYEGTFELVAATSRDGGATFTEATVDADVVPPEPFLVFLPPLPAATRAPGGAVHVAWSDGRSESPAVLLSTSENDGATWSPPRRVDADEGEAFVPQLGTAPAGRLDVVYAEVGGGEGGPTRIRFTSSSDDGRTFGPAAALNEPFARAWLPVSPRAEAGAGPDLGSGLGLVSADKGAFVAWPDTRRGGLDTRRTDIVGAPVRITGDGAPRRLPAP